MAGSAEVTSPMPLSLGTCCGSDASYPLPGEAASGRGLPDRARGGAGGGLTRVWLSPLAGGVRAAGTSHLQPQAAPGAQRPHRWAMGASNTHSENSVAGKAAAWLCVCGRAGNCLTVSSASVSRV